MSPLSRRTVLLTAAAAALPPALAGCTADQGPAPRAYCVARGQLDEHRMLAGRPLVYEVTEERSRFAVEPVFSEQLEGWLEDYVGLTRVQVDQVWTYGAWADRDDGCRSWHNAGRAFDLSRLRLPNGSFVSCRYDRWRSDQGAQLADRLRRYWALAATMQLHFATVLTYLYDGRHANHIHVDNGRSGPELSAFSPRSRPQVQVVQAICRHLWAVEVEPTGMWDRATRTAVAAVAEHAGLAGDLADGPAAWHGFLRASAGRGG